MRIQMHGEQIQITRCAQKPSAIGIDSLCACVCVCVCVCVRLCVCVHVSSDRLGNCGAMERGRECLCETRHKVYSSTQYTVHSTNYTVHSTPLVARRHCINVYLDACGAAAPLDDDGANSRSSSDSRASTQPPSVGAGAGWPGVDDPSCIERPNCGRGSSWCCACGLRMRIVKASTPSHQKSSPIHRHRTANHKRKEGSHTSSSPGGGARSIMKDWRGPALSNAGVGVLGGVRGEGTAATRSRHVLALPSWWRASIRCSCA